MSDENELSADEKAYFETGGNPPVTNEASAEPAEVEQEEDLSAADEGEAAEPAESDKKVRTVPHQALHAERTKRQEIERQLQAEREARARLDERVRMINDALERQKAPEPAKIPSPEEDPIGALKYVQEQQQQIAERERALEQQRAQEAEVSKLDNAYRNDWSGFIAKTPDAVEAYNHVTNVLDLHFQMRGVSDPMQRAQLVMGEERAIAQAAFAQGKSPAQLMYEQAKIYGYTPKVAAPTAQEGNKALEQIERKQKAMPAARSLSSAGGAAGDNAITAETLANMSEEEFGDYMSKLSPAKQRALFGG